MQYPYFPVKLDDLRSRMRYMELEEGFLRVGNVRVDTQYLNHTAPTVAYRLSSAGATVAYVTDHEPFWNPAARRFQHPGDRRHIEFLKGADLIIHDAQYTREEYRSKVGWGHSTIEYATDIALAAGAARLALFHHDPGRDDVSMQGLEEAARARVARHSGRLEVFAAAEGLALHVHGKGNTSTIAEGSALQHRPLHCGRVMLVSADELRAASIARVLGEDDLALAHMPDRRTALAQAPTVAPDVVIIDERLPDGEGATLIPALRARLKRRDLPVIILTDGTDREVSVRGGLAAATDYLAHPMGLPLLRTRVRAWLVRTLAPLHTSSRKHSRRARRA
jgi:CheY-like chemotaxis protein